MKKRFGRVLALILAMSLVMANVCAASATDSQAGITDSAVLQEHLQGEVKTEETDVASDQAEAVDTQEAEQISDNEAEPEQIVENTEVSAEAVKQEQSEADAQAVTELRYENEEVEVTVSAQSEGAIPTGAQLQVVPITSNDDATKEQYKEVKEHIQAKADEEEKGIAGFLAYDITFVDAQGNEIEPNGEVKVSIDYKNATLPEGISEADAKDTNVTVYHLEENENGEVKEVVDMSQADNKIRTMEMTDEKKVEKVEVLTESFSVFTIIWTGGMVEKRLDIQIVDEDGNSIGDNGNREFTLDREYSVTEIAKEISVPDGYSFKNAKIGSKFSSAKTSVLRLRNYRENWSRKNQYSSATSGNRWADVENNKIYFIFEQKEAEIGTIETVDTSKEIDIALYDYAKGENLNSSTRKEGLLFNSSDTGEKYNKWIGYWNNGYSGDNDSYAVQGIVDHNLRNQYGRTVDDYIHYDGQLYPKLNVGSKQTLTELFDSKHRVASDLNHLFVKDENGYYSYDSAKNYAYYNKENNNKDFVVYNKPFDKGEDKQGDFMPLENYNESSDFYYGMTVGFNFIQPTGGLVDGKPMKFEFSGDDDVWVFIDGQLVLDIGGIHGATSGSINFATGEVKVGGVVKSEQSGIDGGLGKTTTLQKIFGLDNKTFDKHTEHRLEFIYLERGAGESNCNLRFNIQIIPEGITVQKQIDNYDEGAYTDVEFQFKLYLQDSKDLTKFNQVTAGEYEVKRSGTSEREIRKLEDSNGIFKLKHDEMAIFEELAEKGTKYYVEEIGMNQDEYDDVVITGSSVTEEYGKIDYSDGTTDVIAKSQELEIGKNPYIVFHNRCAATNMKQLTIKKELQGVENSDEEFEIQVKVGGELYKGEYKSDLSNDTKSTDNGKIRIKPGETITVLGNVKTDDGKKVGFPSGTSFEVEEVNYDSNVYKSPLYEIKAGTADNASTDSKASGKFTKDKNANVIITNVLKESEKTDDVPHHKYIDYLGDGGKNGQTNLSGNDYYRLYLDVKGIPNIEPEPADIVLILDYSSSMHNEFGGLTRWDYVKKSANVAVNTLLPDNSGLDTSKKNQIGIVWFDKRANEKNVSFTSDKNALLNNIKEMKYDSGTNYQAAFWNAQKMLGQSSDRKKFAIFVTDGEPYQYYDGEELEDNLKSDGTDKAKKAAEEAAKLFKDLDGFYAVSVGKDTGTEFLRNKITGNVNAPTKDTIIASDEKELEEAFKSVLGSITKQIGNVTITDTLSDYVTFADENGAVDLLEKYDTDKDGVLKGSVTDGKKDKLTEDLGLKVNTYTYNEETYDSHTDIKDAKEYTGSYTYEIDLNTKTIKLNFGSDYFLERDVVYTLSFNVKLTEKATDEAMDKEQTKGDLNTDYPDNSTSSGQQGLYSNKEATITYERVVNGKKQEESKSYERPVVQPRNEAWEIVKKSVNGDLFLEGAEFRLENTEDSSKFYIGISNSDGKLEWIKDNTPIDASEIPRGIYKLTETKAPMGYQKSKIVWTIDISAEVPTVIGSNGTQGVFDKVEIDSKPGQYVYQLVITNGPLYKLPSAGGNGIYWYMVSGVLLMTVAGMLILYKNKRKEVLES